jgi:hypothetical protein
MVNSHGRNDIAWHFFPIAGWATSFAIVEFIMSQHHFGYVFITP